MEDQTAIFNNAAVLVSAGAAGISAVCALLTFVFYLFSRKKSRREMVDILKLEILQVVSNVQGREAWITAAAISRQYEGGGVGPRIDRLASLLGIIYQSKLKSKSNRKSKYQKDKWMAMLPIALEELKKEGYKDLLGL